MPSKTTTSGIRRIFALALTFSFALSATLPENAQADVNEVIQIGDAEFRGAKVYTDVNTNTAQIAGTPMSGGPGKVFSIDLTTMTVGEATVAGSNTVVSISRNGQYVAANNPGDIAVIYDVGDLSTPVQTVNDFLVNDVAGNGFAAGFQNGTAARLTDAGVQLLFGPPGSNNSGIGHAISADGVVVAGGVNEFGIGTTSP